MTKNELAGGLVFYTNDIGIHGEERTTKRAILRLSDTKNTKQWHKNNTEPD